MRDGLVVLGGTAALVACCALLALGIAVIGGVGIGALFGLATAALAFVAVIAVIIWLQQQMSSARKAKR